MWPREENLKMVYAKLVVTAYLPPVPRQWKPPKGLLQKLLLIIKFVLIQAGN